MKLYILDQVLEYKNNKDSIDSIFDKINQTISNSSLILSHLIIDEYELYGDFHDYILDNIKYIEKIEVITKTVVETAHEIMLSTIDYIENSIQHIEILSDEFYKTPGEGSWNKLINLIEGLKWIVDGFMSIDSSVELRNIVNSYEQWNLYAQDIYSLKELIKEFEEVLQNNDSVSIADILSYEIVPIFNNMKEKLEKTIIEKVEQ